MKINFIIFIYILFNISIIKSYLGKFKIILSDVADDYLETLKIGNTIYNENLIRGDNSWETEMFSGDEIILELISYDGYIKFITVIEIEDYDETIVKNFECNCTHIYHEYEINPSKFTHEYNGIIISYIPYECNNVKIICNETNNFICEKINLTFFTSLESSSSISDIKNYFNNHTEFYIIPHKIPNNIKIYSNSELMSENNFYSSNNNFTFESTELGTKIFSFKGTNINKRTDIKSKYPCNTTLITCFKGCKICLGKNDATKISQNCSLCNSGYIFFENITNLGCCFPDTTEIDGYYIDYNESKYKKCHDFCLKCKNSSTNCSECKKGYFYYNFQCLSQCPNGTHINEDGNLCICNNKFYINDSNKTICLKKEENCKDTKTHLFFLEKKGECLKECNKDEYPYSFDNICYNKCPNNSILIKDNKICKCKYKYYKENNKTICLNENEECNEKYPYLITNKNECVKSCDESKLYIFNNQCLSTCDGNKIKSNDNKHCICRFYYYIKNLFFYCLNENEKCPEEYLYLYENKICLNNCPENYLSLNYECIKNCPENYYEFNLTCVQTCPEKYYKTINRICENIDCLERDINENILLIHESSYEEFIGKNTCDFNNKNYKYFTAEIYDSNIILKNSYNKTSIDLKECENILKKVYNISENKSLTIFKIDYYFDNKSSPKMEYKIFNNDKILNLSYCENISFSISIPVDLEKLNIDISKFNETLNYPEIDIFDINSNFFNDICSMFTTSNKTDVPLNDRKKDYFQNVSLCNEGCVYGSFNKTSFKVNCVCGNTQLIKKNNIEDNIINLFSNSNLKILKCVSLYLIPKNYLKNYGSFLFKTIEFFEIILFILTLIKGYFPIINSIKKNNYFNNNKNNNIIINNNPPKKNNIETLSINNFNNKKFNSKINNIIIYRNINVYEDSNNSKNILYKDKVKNILIKNKIYKNEEINQLDYENFLLIDNRSFLMIYYSFLEYSQLIIFTFITNTDFNIRQIKIALFIFSFILFLTFNTLFFTDESMSHIYKQGGAFDFIYNLPKTIFSGVCCGVINFLLKFLSLSQKDIDKLNKINNEKDKIKEINKFKKNWYCKIIIFYILIFIFIELFQIYVGTFCLIYKNTQKHLFKSTTISFILSMIYPFGICLLTAIFRKISLIKKNKFLFLLSKLLQMF